MAEKVGALPATASAADVDAVLSSFSAPPGESRLAAAHEMIDRVLAHDSVEDILRALAHEPGELAAETLHVMGTRSPTSLKLTLRLLRAGRPSGSLAECLERELGACLQILHQPDFYEGVRAAVIDKDRNPKWSPASLAEVNEADLDRFFVKAEPPLFTN